MVVLLLLVTTPSFSIFSLTDVTETVSLWRPGLKYRLLFVEVVFQEHQQHKIRQIICVMQEWNVNITCRNAEQKTPYLIDQPVQSVIRAARK